MENQYFWSVVVEPNWVQVALWTISEQKARVISVSKGANWDSEKDVLEIVDEEFSEASALLPDSAPEPDAAVFGVSPSWVSDGQIKKERISVIREISKNLSLKPRGFVVLSEAIAHEIKVSEGAPLSAIVVGINTKDIDVTLFKLGQISGSVQVARSTSLPDDLVEALARFESRDALPSRILLYGGDDKELEEYKQVLTTADFLKSGHENVKFLHMPYIEFVPAQKRMVAVSLAGASEMESVGAVSGPGDNLPAEEDANVKDAQGQVSAQDLGFVLGGGASPEADQPPRSGVQLSGLFSRIRPPNIRSLLPVPLSLPTLGGRGRLVAIPAILFVILFAALLLFWWFVPRAEVSIFVSPRRLENTAEVVFDEGVDEADFAGRVLPARKVSTTIEGQKTASATGSKTVGERAVGTVTLRNGTSQDTELPAGTVLTGPSGLTFTLDSEVTIEAAVSPTEPGSIDASVTADEFGAEYNLASGESFSVSNFPKSEMDGIVAEDLTGGSSREIVSVSQSDLDNLDESLRGELTEKAESELTGEVVGAEILLRDTTATNITGADFSHRAGDEASTVELVMELEVTGVVVLKDLVRELAQSVLSEQIPEGFVLRSEQVETDFSLVNEKDGVWTFGVQVIANLLPSVDPGEVARKIAGKNKEEAEEALKDIPGYKGAEASVGPKFLGLFRNIPRNTNNISIEVIAER